ncbi:VOC family protein [Blastococcus sp. Marseille-P5729]|uniref:VOC family protein n=1 Tax=Blastococcus sp. Marseille-P5729 TaxID=2086582 RepID=UPI000D10CD83|nr:VOC family protein [Blastococcus sp. Marseille-P5729]
MSESGQIDHFVYGVRDLAQAVDAIEQRTGIRPTEGGRHIGRGTRNYLLGLSPDCYLEIIALDGENPVSGDQNVAFHLDQLESDRVLTWAIHPADTDGALVKARRHGADHGKLTPMSRVDADGNELHWTLAVDETLPLHGLAPFFIDWGDSLHPAASGIAMAELTDLEITAPDADAVNALYRDLRLDVTAKPGEPAIRITIAGPAGTMTL